MHVRIEIDPDNFKCASLQSSKQGASYKVLHGAERGGPKNNIKNASTHCVQMRT